MTATSKNTKQPIERMKSVSKSAEPKAAHRLEKSPRRASRKSLALTATATAAAPKTSKRDQLAALLVRDEGATLQQMIAATGWLPHTTRAALTGLRKAGYAIDSDKVDGVRTYRGIGPK